MPRDGRVRRRLVEVGACAGRAGGIDAERLAQAQQLQRRASFYVDYVEAENSSGFHAPQEAARILAESIDYVRLGIEALGPYGVASEAVAVAERPGR